MRKKIKGFLFFTIVLYGMVLMLSFSSIAQVSQSEKQERDFLIYSEFSNLVVEEGAEIDLDIKVINQGSQPEDIILELMTDPNASGWDVVLRNESWRGFKVRQINLLTKEPDHIKTLNMHIQVPEAIELDMEEYTFTIQANTMDQRISRSLDITIAVTKKTEKEAEDETKEILLSTKYPTLESPSGGSMNYEIEIKNETELDQLMEFAIDLPQGWRASVSPRWREEEKISAIKINKAGTETILLTVTPPFSAEKGEYPLKFVARAGELEKSLDLKALVTGTFKIGLGTESGNLKLSTVAGEEKEFSFFIWNEGSAAIDNISFISSAPQGWEVKFEPEKMNELRSVVETQKPEKVNMTIKVPQNTVPGDYIVTINANGNQDQKQLEFRTTVQVPTKWGWVGVFIILAILAILFGIFLKLKRR